MLLPRRNAAAMFLAFAFAYFFSALLRAVTATLAPALTQEFSLHARDLGLLAGGYFLGFSATQLPMGRLLDRHGPRKVVLGLLAVAVTGCLAFSLAEGFTGLMLARVLTGVGVSACLMAPLTGYRRWLSPQVQVRANAWMLMSGSLGMVAATLPVQWLVPALGWRPLFWGLAVLLLAAMALIAWRVPAWPPAVAEGEADPRDRDDGYAQVWRHPYFRSLVPVGFFSYGGMVAMQTLWAGPWMVKVAGFTPAQSAAGLFAINLAMLVAFWLWGWAYPALLARGWDAGRLIARGMPLSFVALAALLLSGADAGAWHWAFFCVASTFGSLAQPAVGLAFPSALAGRALSAYNLVIFAGIFVTQWGMGLLIDGFQVLGLEEADRFRAALSVFAVASVLSWAFFLAARPDNARP